MRGDETQVSKCCRRRNDAISGCFVCFMWVEEGAESAGARGGWGSEVLLSEWTPGWSPSEDLYQVLFAPSHLGQRT